MKLIIQIPCFNEEQTLPETLADLPRCGLAHERGAEEHLAGEAVGGGELRLGCHRGTG